MKNDETFTKVTVLNGFHHVYPSQALFERHVETGRKEVIELYNLLPKEFLTGGYDAAKYTITVQVEHIQFGGYKQRRKRRKK